MEHNILLVDDDPGLIRVMARMLAGLGQFRFATHGEAALQQARDWQPDLMILDAEMPGMSGFQVCEAMKADPALRDVPIIFVTSHTDHDFEVKGLELGAADFIAKPVNEALVLARVRTQLRIKRLTDDLRRVATKDLVTRLPNRVSFEEDLSREWMRGLRAGSAVSLLMVEIDHLDLYTERYGHQMVDKCLRRVSQALQGLCGNPADLLARFDHNTFALLLPETEQGQAERLAHQVMDAVESLAIDHDTSPTSRHVTTTVGMSSYDASSDCWVTPMAADSVGDIPACDADDLIRCALAALMAARTSGRAQSWCADIVPEAARIQVREVSALSRPAPLKALA
jgi:diguanylate cyclase (GGDEF)-like protein